MIKLHNQSDLSHIMSGGAIALRQSQNQNNRQKLAVGLVRKC
ncbi:hypothetical protein QUA86_32375 [Microcoleus sp. F6_B6]